MTVSNLPVEHRTEALDIRTAESHMLVVGAYVVASGLTLISVGSLLGLGGFTLGLVPTHDSASGALTFGLTIGGLVAATYIAIGATVRGIFAATQRAEHALLEPPKPKPQPPLHGALSPVPMAGELSMAPKTKGRGRK